MAKPPVAPPTKVRRSARLAKQQAALRPSDDTDTSATPSDQAKKTAVKDVVRKAEADIAKRPPEKRARSPDGSSSSSSDSDRTRDSPKKPPIPGVTPTGEDEPSGKKPTCEDDPAVTVLWSYRATKDAYIKAIPRPLRITNPRVLKTARLWPLLWDTLSVVASDFVSERDLDGEVSRAFTEAFSSFYNLREGGCSADPGLILRIKDKWKILGALYLAAEDPETLFLGAGKRLMEDVSSIIQGLDATHLGRVHGPRAKEIFQQASLLPLDQFGDENVEAARLAIRKRSSKHDDRRRGRPGECELCGATVLRGKFKEHNLICPNR